MDNALLIKDLFLSICFYMSWRELTHMRRWSKFHRDVITDNAKKLVVSVCRKKQNIDANIIPGRIIQLGNCSNCECVLDIILRSHHLCDVQNCTCEMHFTDMSGYHCRCQNQEFKNMVTSKCSCKFKKINSWYCDKEINDIIASEYFFQNCYHLDLTGLHDFKWWNILAFDNRMHYLSLNGTELCIPNIASSKRQYPPQNIMSLNIHRQDNITLQQISDFFEENFNGDEIELFLKYGDICDWFYTEQRKYHIVHTFDDICVCKHYPPEKNEPHWIDLYYIVATPKDSPLYQNYVDIILSDLEFIKKTIERYSSLQEWFATAEIDIIDLTGSKMPNNLMKLLTGCKRIIIGSEEIKKETQEILREYGVEIITT